MDETAPVPMHLRNAPTTMMKEMKYGEGYLYNPSYRHGALTSVISAYLLTTFCSHPVYQTYLPPLVAGEGEILLAEGDTTGKIFDEGLLRQWEWRTGRDWPGRGQPETKVETEGDQKGQDL